MSELNNTPHLSLPKIISLLLAHINKCASNTQVYFV